MDADFRDLFTEEHFRDVFSKMKYKRGGGRDRLSGMQYAEKYDSDFSTVPEKCKSLSYTFTPYNERLILKGRNKFPRVISVPTIRDRIVLKVLNEYLQSKFPERVRRLTPNEYIRTIKSYCSSKQWEVNFIKADLTDFYGSILHDVLLDILSKRVCTEALILIERAIKTPTLGLGETNRIESEIGVPQGLAISNLLADIYAGKLDEAMKADCGLYLRYVDDILVLDTKINSSFEGLETQIKGTTLGLSINKDKYADGNLSKTPLDYLGYKFLGGVATVRKDKVTLIFDKLAKECTGIKRAYNEPSLRGGKFVNADSYFSARIELLNMIIGGIRSNNRLYGWSLFYQQIDDVALLDHLDRFIRNQLSFLPAKTRSKVMSFRKVHYRLLKGEIDKVAFDFDEIDTIAKKREFLSRFGIIFEDDNIKDECVELLFDVNKRNISRRLESHIGGIS